MKKTHEEFLLKRYTCKQFYPRYFSPQLVLYPDFLTHHKDAPVRQADFHVITEEKVEFNQKMENKKQKMGDNENQRILADKSYFLDIDFDNFCVNNE